MFPSSATIPGLITAALLGQPISDAQSGRGCLVTARIEDRVVKTFDFDERALGNYEELPMNWNRITGSGYPWFLKPRFDHEVGHSAPPSFRLALEGGSLGVHYLAKDIPVHPSSDYRITGWVRPDGLVHAGARLTAYFLDHALRKIEASERQSQVVRGADADRPWRLVRIDLPGGWDSAAWIGLSCRVEQPEVTPSSPENPCPIDHRDVHGVAWFDDITVLRLPQATLKLTAPGNLCLAGQPTGCLARVADPDGVGLVATLEIMNADHEILQTHPVPVVGIDGGAALIPIEALPAGAYTARLSVCVGSREVIVKEQAFVQLNPDVDNPTRDRHGFGLILDPSEAVHRRISERLLRAVLPDVVKVSLWRSDTDDQAIVRGDPRLDNLLHALRELDIGVVATLEAPPKSLATPAGRSDCTLIGLLSSPPDPWRPYLALVLTRYGSYIGAWQVGADWAGETLQRRNVEAPQEMSKRQNVNRQSAASSFSTQHAVLSPQSFSLAGSRAPFSDQRLTPAIANMRAELEPLIGSPDIVVPVPVQSRPDAASLPADILCLTVPSHIPASRLSSQLAAFAHLGFARRWATIRLPDPTRYARQPRLIEFAQRIVIARHSGIDTVFVRQPWTVETRDGDIVVTPGEEFIVLRTLTQALGGLESVAPVWIGHGLHAWVFADKAMDAGAIVAWADADGAGPRRVVADVGPDARRIDMWANVTDMLATGEGREFVVDAMPTVITPVNLRRARMLSGFAVDDPTFRVATAEHERTVTLANPPGSKMRGTLRLETPVGWRVRPKQVEIDLAGGDVARIQVSFRIPNNQAVGDYTLVGRLAIEDEGVENLTVRAPMYVRSPGLNVNVLTRLNGDRLDVVQRITNLTDDNLSLRSFLIAPEMSFEPRVIAKLAAGQTAVREYQIEDARHLSGRHIRVSVQQIGGPLKHNQVISFD